MKHACFLALLTLAATAALLEPDGFVLLTAHTPGFGPEPLYAVAAMTTAMKEKLETR